MKGITKPSGNFHWKAPVESSSDLPSTASIGDARVVKDENAVYHYDGSSWNNITGHNIKAATVTTTDATITDITTVSVAEGEVFLVEAQVIGRKSDGSQLALYHREGLFYRNTGGDVTQQGSITSLAEVESDASWDCTLNADTTNQTIDVRVTGVADTTINWKCVIKYMKVT